MASRDLASYRIRCQANILKVWSSMEVKMEEIRRDLLKVIHYAMLLLHFDEHYGKPINDQWKHLNALIMKLRLVVMKLSDKTLTF